MNINTALAISIGILGGLATWFFIGDPLTLGLNLQIWAAFIAWACYFHCGGNIGALGNGIAANIWGIIAAAVGLIVFSKFNVLGLPAPVWAGICVGVAVFVMLLLTQLPFLSAIPATVYGFAATAAFVLLTDSAGALTAPSLANPAVVIAMSMVAGSVLGYISGTLAGVMAKS